MHLGDRGGRVGLALDVDEYFERRAAERLLELRRELVKGNGRYLAVQARELGGPCRRQKVLSRREHLAELDESESQLPPSRPPKRT